MIHDTVKKSCLRSNKTNYCRVQFMDDNDHADITPPASPTDCTEYADYSKDHDINSPSQGELAQKTSIGNEIIYQSLYKKEKRKTELLERQIQHLQLQLMDKDRRLALDDNYKYVKISHLVNEISFLSSTDDDDDKVDQHPIVSSSVSSFSGPEPKAKKRQRPSILETIHDRLQHILFNLMVTQQQQQQQTKLQYNPHDDYQLHATSIYY